jgi:hypothetical protein
MAEGRAMQEQLPGGAMKQRILSLLILLSGALGVLPAAATDQQSAQLQPPPWPKVVKRLSPQDFVEVPRAQLPPGVKAFGEGGEPKWLKTANPRIVRVDLNGDGDPELIVAHTYWLSAKGVFHEVYQKNGGTYKRIGDLDAVNDVKLLEVANGFNQIEAWVGGDGERPTYARLLWRYEGKEYRLVRADDFGTNESGKRVYSGTRGF